MLLISVGRLDLFYQSTISNPNATKARLLQTLKDLNIQSWNWKLLESTKGRTYIIFKEDVSLENYLSALSRNIYLPLIKFRTTNHKLPVEKGRWENIPHKDRKCNLCDKNDIGDEFHYLFTCPFFAGERAALIKPYFYNRPNILKFKELLQSRNKKLLIHLSQFVKRSWALFSEIYHQQIFYIILCSRTDRVLFKAKRTIILKNHSFSYDICTIIYMDFALSSSVL